MTIIIIIIIIINNNRKVLRSNQTLTKEIYKNNCPLSQIGTSGADLE